MHESLNRQSAALTRYVCVLIWDLRVSAEDWRRLLSWRKRRTFAYPAQSEQNANVAEFCRQNRSPQANEGLSHVPEGNQGHDLIGISWGEIAFGNSPLVVGKRRALGSVRKH